MNTKETRKNIIQAGRKAVEELIKVAKEKIIINRTESTSCQQQGVSWRALGGKNESGGPVTEGGPVVFPPPPPVTNAPK